MAINLDQRLGPNFASDLVSLSQANGVDPKGAAQVLMFESQLNPAAQNPSSHALGLNQLIPSNWGVFAPLSASQYAALSADGQLPYVFRFWSSVLHQFGRGAKFFAGSDLYWLNIAPGTFVPNAPDSHVVSHAGQSVYEGNKGNLDFGNKGFITKGDFSTALQLATHNQAALWAALSSQIDSLAPSGISSASVGEIAVFAALGLAFGAAAYVAYERGFA